MSGGGDDHWRMYTPQRCQETGDRSVILGILVVIRYAQRIEQSTIKGPFKIIEKTQNIQYMHIHDKKEDVRIISELDVVHDEYWQRGFHNLMWWWRWKGEKETSAIYFCREKKKSHFL
jgi:hypothetical protein